MNGKKKVFCLLFAVLMLFTLSITAFAGNETNDGNIKIEVATNKGSYGATSVAEITATITNIGSSDLKNVIAQAVFDDLAPAGKRTSETSKSIDVLKSGESFSFKYKATLNDDEHKLNIFQKIILFFVRLFNGGYNANNNNIDVVAECVTEIKFGKFTADNVVQVGYISDKFTEQELDSMSIVDNTLKDLKSSNSFKSLEEAERKKQIEIKLKELEDKKMIYAVRYDYKTKSFIFMYSSGISGGISLEPYQNKPTTLLDEASLKVTQNNSFLSNMALVEESDERLTNIKKKAFISYGWDNYIDNSETYLFYLDIENSLKNSGYATTFSTSTTVEEYKTALLNHDLICINEHGITVSVYDFFGFENEQMGTTKYIYGFVVIETPTTETDSLYSEDLKAGRIYKRDNVYCIAPKFFSHYYSENKLDDSIVFMGTCSAFGEGQVVDYNFSHEFSEFCGVDAVVGFHNTVRIGYAGNVMRALATDLMKGISISDSLNNTEKIYGCNDCEYLRKIYSEEYLINYIENNGKSLKENLEYDEENNLQGTIWFGGDTSIRWDVITLIQGTVTDNETGKPISGVNVIAVDKTDNYNFDGEFTDENGQYTLAVKLGSYEMSFHHDNYEYIEFDLPVGIDDIQKDISLTPKPTMKNILIDNTWYCNIQDYCEYKFYEDGTVVENPDSDFSRTMTYTVTNDVLTIYWDESGEPYSTSSLKYVTKNDSCDWNKDLFFYNVIYNEIADDEYFFYEYDYEPDEMGLVNAMWLRCKNDTFEDDKTFTGTVLDEVTEKPIPNVIVNITEQGDSLNNILEMVITDENGDFSLNLPDGDYILEFLHDDYEMDFAFITIGSDENNSIFYLTQLETRTVTASGNCGAVGDNVTWTLYDDGELVISGSGEMTSFDYNNSPWYSHCKNISKVTICDGVTSIGEWAFQDCYLTSINICDSVTAIGERAFYYCKSLISINIPDGVNNIGSYAFYCCDSLTNITIPNGVTSIGNYAFMYCKSLTSITIPNSVKTIGYMAFYCCESLTSITIPDSVTTIGDDAFHNCENLTSITVDSNNMNYSSDGYGVLFNKDKTELIQYSIGNKRMTYTIPSSVTTIGYKAFYCCESLTSITIPDSVTSIGDWAFGWCRSLTNITIPDSVTSIGDWAFYCTSLTSITIPDSVTVINFRAFYDCYYLTSITIPDSVTAIGSYAFGNCYSLTDVFYVGTEEEWNKITIVSNNDNLINATIHYNA